MGAGPIQRVGSPGAWRSARLLAVLAVAFMLVWGGPGLAQNNPVPRTKQEVRNNRSNPAGRPNQQFPRSGYNNPSKGKRAGEQPGRPARNNRSNPVTRPDQQFPRSGYNNPQKGRTAGQQQGRPTRNNQSNSSIRPNQQFPQSGLNNPTPESRRANQQFPKVEKSAHDRAPLLRANSNMQSVEQKVAAAHPKIKKKMKRKSRKIARSQRGRTMSRQARKRFMRMQARIMGPAVEGQVESNAQKRAKAGNNSEAWADLTVGDATHPSVKRRRQRAESRLQKSGNGPVVDESGLSKRIRARSQSLKINRHVEPVIPDYANQVAIMAAGSADASEFYMMEAEHIGDKQARAYAKSKQIAKASQGWGGVNLKARKARQEQKSFIIAESKGKIAVPSREAQTALARDQSLKIANSEKGNTMAREDYRIMVRKKSEKIANFEKGNALRREAHTAMMRGKSDDIADFDVRYLNTRAEKRARIRSFFHPDEFVANTPKEQLNKRRDMSGDIAAFEGKKRRGKREEKNAHASTVALNKKRNIRDYEDRESTRKHTANRLRWNRKGLLPVWMRKKEKKAKYDDVEKGLWYD